MDFVRMSVDCIARCPCSENLRMEVASCRGDGPSRFRLSYYSRLIRCGEGSNLRIMSASGQGRSSVSRESSLSSKPGWLSMKDSLVSWRQTPRRRPGDGVCDDRAEAVSGPSSSTVGPDHLVVFVNGINGSGSDWIYTLEQFKLKLADKVVVHCSTTNASRKTFDGVDVMGDRLAHEVRKEVKNNPGVTKISFLGHSLGGLISRYAIGQLYAPPGKLSSLEERSEASTIDSEAGGSGRDQNPAASITHEKATIAGLEPINFITLATPHLGCRDNRHLPFLLGVVLLEKVAHSISHWFIGETGKHLFLADGGNGHEPLLERMVTDCDDGRFLSALSCFEKRTAYANVSYDHLVGWRTASIRKQAEMPERLNKGIDPKYPHIVREEAVSESKDVPARDDMEEVMVTGLQKVSWWRVDVDFSNKMPSPSAHYLIQVKNCSSHSKGADVIDHIIDKHFKVYKAAGDGNPMPCYARPL